MEGLCTAEYDNEKHVANNYNYCAKPLGNCAHCMVIHIEECHIKVLNTYKRGMCNS